MAMALPIMAGASMVTGVISSIQQSQAQAANLQAQANAQKYNQELYNNQAQNAMASAVSQANLQQHKNEQALGSQRAAVAEAGGGFNGSAGELLTQSANNAELDRQYTLYSGLLNSNSLINQGNQSGYASQIAQSQIGPTLTSGYMNATGNILSGAASYYGNKSKQDYASRGQF